MRERYRRRCLILVALLTCWLLPAQSPESTLPGPSSGPPMVLLADCEEELTRLEQLSIAQVTKLEGDFEVTLREAVERAAADAALPLLVAVRERETAARRWRAVAVVELVCIAVLSVVFALVPSR